MFWPVSLSFLQTSTHALLLQIWLIYKTCLQLHIKTNPNSDLRLLGLGRLVVSCHWAGDKSDSLTSWPFSADADSTCSVYIQCFSPKHSECILTRKRVQCISFLIKDWFRLDILALHRLHPCFLASSLLLLQFFFLVHYSHHVWLCVALPACSYMYMCALLCMHGINKMRTHSWKQCSVVLLVVKNSTAPSTTLLNFVILH